MSKPTTPKKSDKFNWRLFFSLVWREFEPKSCGIPGPYRIKYRISIKQAWRITKAKQYTA